MEQHFMFTNQKGSPAVKIIQISDTHITHLGGETNENAKLAVEIVNSLEPDFVVPCVVFTTKE